MLFLRSESTGLVAPIDLLPAPGGQCEVDKAARVYVLHPPHVARGLDPTTTDLDAQPTLHFRHFDTCISPQNRSRMIFVGGRSDPLDDD